MSIVTEILHIPSPSNANYVDPELGREQNKIRRRVRKLAKQYLDVWKKDERSSFLPPIIAPLKTCESVITDQELAPLKQIDPDWDQTSRTIVYEWAKNDLLPPDETVQVIRQEALHPFGVKDLKEVDSMSLQRYSDIHHALSEIAYQQFHEDKPALDDQPHLQRLLNLRRRDYKSKAREEASFFLNGVRGDIFSLNKYELLPPTGSLKSTMRNIISDTIPAGFTYVTDRIKTSTTIKDFIKTHGKSLAEFVKTQTPAQVEVFMNKYINNPMRSVFIRTYNKSWSAHSDEFKHTVLASGGLASTLGISIALSAIIANKMTKSTIFTEAFDHFMFKGSK